MRRLQSNNFIQEKEKKGGILQNFLCPLNVYSGSLDSWNPNVYVKLASSLY